MNIIITGASSGIGQALKKHYEAKGNTVINVSRTDADYNCDITDRAKLEEAFKDIASKFKQIDMLINCAGFGVSGAIETTPIDKVQSIFDVNVIGSVNCIQLTLPIMSERGKIANISSVTALFPIPFRGYYCASKAALSTLSDSLRMELAHTKIQTTAICPSDIKTNFTKNRVKSFETNERYGDAIEKSTKYIDAREDKRMSVDKAVKIITKWLDKKHLKPQYIMTFKFKLLNFAKGILPKSLYLKMCNKFMNKG